MPEQIVLGIDPGISGAYAFYWPNRDMVAVEDAPIIDGNIDAANMASAIDIMHPSVAIIERVSAMPKQGVASMFAFGEAYGAIKGIVAAHFLPVTLVTPVTWKAKLKVSKNKDDARYRASQLMPSFAHFWSRRRDDGLAEAALIAFYGQNFGGVQ